MASTSLVSKKTLDPQDFKEFKGLLTEEEFKRALDQRGYDDDILNRAKFIKLLNDQSFFKISFSQGGGSSSNGYFDTIKGLPPLGVLNASLSQPSISLHHKEASLKQTKFNILPLNLFKDFTSSIWNYYEPIADQGLENTGEDTIASHVRLVIGDVLRLIEMRDKFGTLSEYGIFGLRPDLWVIKSSFGIPVGVVEVKKPGKELSNCRSNPQSATMNHKKVLGQVYDYLVRLTSFYGIKTPFAILTSYSEWRICWLESSDELAKADSVDGSPNTMIESIVHKDDEDEGVVDEGEEEDLISIDEEENKEERVVLCSDVHSHSQKDIIDVLASALWKMIHSSSTQVDISDKNRSLILLTETSWTWIKSPFCKNGFKLSYYSVPHRNTKQFFLLEDFHGGSEGRVWLACSHSGNVAVLKFRNDGDLSELEVEATNWRMLYSSKFPKAKYVRSITVGGKVALFMPYLKRIDDFKNEYVKEAVLSAVEDLIEKGYVPTDLNPRNIMLNKTPNKKQGLKAFFIDIAKVNEVNEDNANEFRETIRRLF